MCEDLAAVAAKIDHIERLVEQVAEALQYAPDAPDALMAEIEVSLQELRDLILPPSLPDYPVPVDSKVVRP